MAGKSSIFSRFARNVYSDDFATTIGVDFCTANLVTAKDAANPQVAVRLHIWDTAGPEKYANIVHSYFRGSHGFVVVFDVTSRESFEDALKCYDMIDRYSAVSQPAGFIVLAGNKCDLHARQVSATEASNKAHERGWLYVDVSAKTGRRVNDVFNYFAYNLPTNRRNSRIRVVRQPQATPPHSRNLLFDLKEALTPGPRAGAVKDTVTAAMATIKQKLTIESDGKVAGFFNTIKAKLRGSAAPSATLSDATAAEDS
eukprot:TRINITY_DN1039_c0_g2_i3.p1 TRINITY_DN1039_c0_g2~~TRINITY_DN1039_c0_g2_i3.p1  ORF type:complete len:256 (+),score=46.48 TRINITY_DN1039_c0_g2_i3:403-1170(+)